MEAEGGAAAVTKICMRCGAQYQTKAWNAMYCAGCSDWMRHHQAAWREERRALELEPPKRKDDYGEIQCALCGKTITRRSMRQIYCTTCAGLPKSSKAKIRKMRRMLAPKAQKLTIADITALARAAGMSYGRYVAAGMPGAQK